MPNRKTSYSLSRILKKDGRTVIVAMDHGGFMGPASGLENPGYAIQAVLRGGADAIMTTFGIIKKHGSLIRGRAGLILSTPVIGEEMRNAAELTKALGADCLKVFVGVGMDDEPENLSALWKASLACRNTGVPLLAEMFPIRGEKVKNPTDMQVVKKYARIGAEYGADIIKTFYTGNESSFREVTTSSMVPVLILGGERTDTDLDLLKMVEDSVRAGGGGVAIGRNIWQHKKPERITRAVSRIVHEGYTAEEAVKEV